MPADNMVSRRRFTYVADGVHLVGCLENDGPGANLLLLSIDKRLHGAFFNNQYFFFGMLVWRVRRFAGIQRGDVAFELVGCRRLRTEKCSDGADGCIPDGNVVPVKNG